MRLSQQVSGIQLKQLGLVTFLIGGLCAGALAQTPTLSLPALPALPQTTAVSSANGSSLPTVNMPTLPVAPVPSTTALSTFDLPKLPEAPTPSPNDAAKNALKDAEKKVEALTTNLPADNTPPVNPEQAMAGTKASAEPPQASSLPPVGMPALPMPNAIAIPDIAIATPTIPEAATALPEISVERDKPKLKTWETTLAPSIIPPRTRFKYKRVQLPESIYSKSYSRENSHLPIRMTQEDYEALLFNQAAQNDIDGTRALLNAGTNIRATNAYGETPLQVARRSGAQDTAALLVARETRETRKRR